MYRVKEENKVESQGRVHVAARRVGSFQIISSPVAVQGEPVLGTYYIAETQWGITQLLWKWRTEKVPGQFRCHRSRSSLNIHATGV